MDPLSAEPPVDQGEHKHQHEQYTRYRRGFSHLVELERIIEYAIAYCCCGLIGALRRS